MFSLFRMLYINLSLKMLPFSPWPHKDIHSSRRVQNPPKASAPLPSPYSCFLLRIVFQMIMLSRVRSPSVERKTSMNGEQNIDGKALLSWVTLTCFKFLGRSDFQANVTICQGNVAQIALFHLLPDLLPCLCLLERKKREILFETCN